MSAPRAAGRAIEAVVIGGSAGSVSALGEILPGLPRDFPPVLAVVHILPTTPSLLAEVFRPRCAMQVGDAESGSAIERGTILFAPSDYHLLVESNRRCALSIEPPVLFSRPAIDVLFESAAHVYKGALLGVVLTGASSDGAAGLLAIHAAGGHTLIQSPDSAESELMPRAAIAAVPGAHVVPLSSLLQAILGIVQPP